MTIEPARIASDMAVPRPAATRSGRLVPRLRRPWLLSGPGWRSASSWAALSFRRRRSRAIRRAQSDQRPLAPNEPHIFLPSRPASA